MSDTSRKWIQRFQCSMQYEAMVYYDPHFDLPSNPYIGMEAALSIGEDRVYLTSLNQGVK